MNPCRPLATVATVRMKDYASSLQSFTERGGPFARKYTDELLKYGQPVNAGAMKLKRTVVPANVTNESTTAVDNATNAAKEVKTFTHAALWRLLVLRSADNCPKSGTTCTAGFSARTRMLRKLTSTTSQIMNASLVAPGESVNDPAAFAKFIGSDVAAMLENVSPSEITSNFLYGVDAISVTSAVSNLSQEGYDVSVLRELVPPCFERSRSPPPSTGQRMAKVLTPYAPTLAKCARKRANPLTCARLYHGSRSPR